MSENTETNRPANSRDRSDADGAVVSAEQLFERVWDEFADPFTATVKTTIRQLDDAQSKTT